MHINIRVMTVEEAVLEYESEVARLNQLDEELDRFVTSGMFAMSDVYGEKVRNEM